MDLLPAHSKIGASSMHRWAVCPGSVQLSAGIESQTSSYAEEGTHAHDVASKILLGQPVTLDMDSELYDAVSVYVDHVNDLWKQAKKHKKSFKLIEHKFDLSSLHPGLFGTADAVVYDGNTKTLYVRDYKHGAGIPVEAKDNEQLLYYALGAQVSLKVPAVTINIGIIQPRCFHEDGPIRIHSIDAFDMLEFEAFLVDAARATEKKDAPLVPGEHCRFCPAVGICPKLHKNAVELAKKQFTDPANYDPEQLAEVLNRIPELNAFIKGVHAFAYKEACAGRPPPGWKLVAKRATRRWRNEESAAAALADHGLTQDEIFEFKMKTPPAIEKLLTKEHKKIITDLVTSESSGLTLAPEGDKREAVKPDAAASFTMIEDETSID